MAAQLCLRGRTVFSPALTGQGGRSHLIAGTVNLSTQITDILKVIYYEGLRDMVLVGHSYLESAV